MKFLQLIGSMFVKKVTFSVLFQMMKLGGMFVKKVTFYLVVKLGFSLMIKLIFHFVIIGRSL